MTKGKPMKTELRKWYIREGMDGDWYIEREDDGAYRRVYGAHCKACAMAEFISDEPDADTDLRGYRNTPCYQFLAVLVRQRRREGPDDLRYSHDH